MIIIIINDKQVVEQYAILNHKPALMSRRAQQKEERKYQLFITAKYSTFVDSVTAEGGDLSLSVKPIAIRATRARVAWTMLLEAATVPAASWAADSRASVLLLAERIALRD